MLTADGFASLRTEAEQHVADARRAGRSDETWEQAYAALDRAVDATQDMVDSSWVQSLIPQQSRRSPDAADL